MRDEQDAEGDERRLTVEDCRAGRGVGDAPRTDQNEDHAGGEVHRAIIAYSWLG